MNDPYIRALFGESAIHVGLNFVVQDAGDGKVGVIGTSCFGKQLMFGSKKTHQLIVGDCIIRPRLVFESDHLVGVGLAGIITSSSMAGVEEWIEHGRLLVKDGMRV